MGEWCDNVDWHDWYRDDNNDAYHNVKVFVPPLVCYKAWENKGLDMERI